MERAREEQKITEGVARCKLPIPVAKCREVSLLEQNIPYAATRHHPQDPLQVLADVVKQEILRTAHRSATRPQSAFAAPTGLGMFLCFVSVDDQFIPNFSPAAKNGVRGELDDAFRAQFWQNHTETRHPDVRRPRLNLPSDHRTQSRVRAPASKKKAPFSKVENSRNPKPSISAKASLLSFIDRFTREGVTYPEGRNMASVL